MKTLLLSTLFALTLFGGVYDGVAVVVKNEAITLYEIKEEMRLSNLSVKEATDALIRKKLETLEMQERKIEVTPTEVYNDIKEMAARNNMSVNQFYDAVREANGLNSEEFKKKIKEKLLSQKLYSAIAYSSLSEPSQGEIEDYYALHKEEFMHPSAITVLIYDGDQTQLEQKVQNPMFNSMDIITSEQKLPLDRVSPELASLLEKTPLNSFTPVIPNGKGGYMTFYIKEIHAAKEGDVAAFRDQIMNAIMAQKRELVLSDYFERLRLNAQINMIRTVE